MPFCPSAALPEAGSYVARIAAGIPLLVVRGDDGRVRAFRNACRHRGMRLADGAGCAKAFVCGYHGWTYRLDGTLAPHSARRPGFPASTRRLTAWCRCTAEEKRRPRLRHADRAPDRATVRSTACRASLPPISASSHYDDRVRRELEVVRRGKPRGLPHQADAQDDVLSVRLRQPDVGRDFGRNNRVTFPFRRIEKLRALPAERAQDRRHGHVRVSPVPERDHRGAIEPHDDVGARTGEPQPHAISHVSADQRRRRRRRRRGCKSDARRWLRCRHRRQRRRRDARGIQNGMASGANEFFTYGHYEQAIVHFHKSLAGVLAAVAH